MDLIQVQLPRGAWRGDRRLGIATLRPLSDDDGAFLAVEGRGLTPFERTSALLERCLALSHPEGIEVTDLPLLGMGDRESLLFHLYREAFGSNIPGVVACPGCEEPLEFDIAADDVLVQPAPDPARSLERLLESGGRRYHCTVRPPTAADVEAVLPLGRTEPRTAADELFTRCVAVVDESSHLAAGLPDPGLVGLLDQTFDELDPQAETLLTLRCAACGLEFQACLDAGEFLARATRRKSTQLFQEVHRLALHYHWSESDILAMSSERRRLYLDLLAADGEAGGL